MRGAKQWETHCLNAAESGGTVFRLNKTGATKLVARDLVNLDTWEWTAPLR